MGQYHYIYNIDKKEMLHPHAFGDGLKMREWPNGGGSLGTPRTTVALAVLLSNSNGVGGMGDYPMEDPEISGRWAGDRIVVQGDYAVPAYKSYIDSEEIEEYIDISLQVKEAIWGKPPEAVWGDEKG